jgi:hypothetical protein
MSAAVIFWAATAAGTAAGLVFYANVSNKINNREPFFDSSRNAVWALEDLRMILFLFP